MTTGVYFSRNRKPISKSVTLKNSAKTTEIRGGDIYTRITNAIVSAIEAGAGDWVMPWHTKNFNLSVPVNAQSNKKYRGINQLCLWAVSSLEHYEQPIWATYQQWQQLGAQVNKGEKGTMIVFWKFVEKPGNDHSIVAPAHQQTEKTTVVPLARAYWVFNVSQVSNYQVSKDLVGLSESERSARAEEFFSATGAKVQHGGDRAYYTPGLDQIQMPEFRQFHDAHGYYSTLAHETVHWTGHSSRCNRNLTGLFGSETYASEELIAELGSAFLCAELEITNQPRPDHASYIQSWLKILKNNKRAIFTAASKAQEAVEWLKQKQQPTTEVAA